jgi:endoglucanase
VPSGSGKQPGKTFFIRRGGDKSVALQGSLEPPKLDPDTGDAIQVADFTPLSEAGRFYLDVPGIGRSWDFAVGPDVFSRVYYLAARSYYGQRCGIAVDLGIEFPGYKHDACHTKGAYHASSGKEGAHISAQGWHDAGDYGRYVVNSGMTTGTLLLAWELYGNHLKNISLHLPESGNGTPDLLNEIRWNLDWMLTMQDADGGVWHKQTSEHFCASVMPDKDDLISYVIGTGRAPFKSSCATGDFAAVMALAARAFRGFDRRYAERCSRAAEAAWKWLDQNPNSVFHNPPGITTGEYGDGDCGDERLWAAAELLRATDKDVYSTYFLSHYREYLDKIGPTQPPSWPTVAPLALWAYALGGGKNAEAVDAIRQKSTDAADQIVQRTERNGYRNALEARDYIWGSNGVAANYGMQLLIADHLKPNRRYVETAMETLHYLLGRNAFSLSWLTQVGEHAVMHPHHRPSVADGITLPWPGLLAGGPNSGRQDPVMKKVLSPDVPAAKCYVDDSEAYGCNEVAINWNAPLVFLLASVLDK